MCHLSVDVCVLIIFNVANNLSKKICDQLGINICIIYILSVICIHLHWLKLLKCKLLAYYCITGKIGGFNFFEATLTSAERLILSTNLDD